MIKRIFLVLVVVIVLSLQSIQRGWFVMTQLFIEKIGSQLISIIEEPQFQGLWREISQGRNIYIGYYLAIVLLVSFVRFFPIKKVSFYIERYERL